MRYANDREREFIGVVSELARQHKIEQRLPTVEAHKASCR
jgi:hypothetical protein